MFSAINPFTSTSLWKAIIVLVVCITTISAFNSFEQYANSGRELLISRDFTGSHAWKTGHEGSVNFFPGDGVARLDAARTRNFVHLTQIVPIQGNFRFLRLACDLSTREVIAGPEPWMSSRVILVFHDRHGAPMRHLPHVVASLTGTNQWQRHETVFPVPEEASQIRVAVQLAGASGTMWVRNISLRPVMESGIFPRIRASALIVWLITLAWLAGPLFRWIKGSPQGRSIAIVGILIIISTLSPDSAKEQIAHRLFPSVTAPHAANTSPIDSYNQFRFTPLLAEPDLFKAGHFILFALLGLIATLRQPKSLPSSLLPHLFIFALTTEVLQLFAVGRSAQLGDFLIDSTGITVGAVLACVTALARLLTEKFRSS